MSIARVFIVGLATVVCAWFVIGIRQADEIVAATAVISRPGKQSTQTLRDAASSLRAASDLNPDSEVDILRGRLALGELRFRRAELILEDVVRREPMNLQAWIWLGGAAIRDPSEAQIVFRQLARLDPRSTLRR